MKEENNRVNKLRVIGIISIVVVIVMTVMWRGNHHEPYVSAESYEELKQLCKKEKTLLFLEDLMEGYTYSWGQTELFNNKIEGYFFVAENNNKSDIEYISMSGFYTKYVREKDDEPIFTDTIIIDNVEVIESFCEDVDKRIIYEFEVEEVKYTIVGGGSVAYQNNIYQSNQELLHIVEMIIKQKG